MKNPLTPAGIEPATFRFVAQHLNHCATAVPPQYHSIYLNITFFFVYSEVLHAVLSIVHLTPKWYYMQYQRTFVPSRATPLAGRKIITFTAMTSVENVV